MGAKKQKTLSRTFERFAWRATKAVGTTGAFLVAFGVVIVWGLSGPIFGFSNTWQLVINTCTTIVTFLMVFLIQHTQNKDSLAVQLKLDEIVSALPKASNKLIDIEDLDDDALEELRLRYQDMADRMGQQQERAAHKRPGRPKGSKAPAR